MDEYKVIGLMSGTSLDGIDIAYCFFEENNGNWKFEIRATETIIYNTEWRKRLNELSDASAEAYLHTNLEYGKLLGESVNSFIKKNKLEIDMISSHGHTVFHQPSKGFTAQVGDGATIALLTGKTVVNNFRHLDVLLGGQGAPLVPIGDRLLFGEYDFCLNLGGFSNISFEEGRKRIAFDVCPVNIILNYIAEKKGKAFDKDGMLARSGNVCDALLNKLNTIPYYSQAPPKSLGKEWLLESFIPVIENFNISLEDKLRTLIEHISFQVSKTFNDKSCGKVLITGGGAYNKFLIEKLKEKSKSKIIIPDPLIIEFKEALIFGFLGVLRIRNEVNCLCSVTGSERDSCSGSIYMGK